MVEIISRALHGKMTILYRPVDLGQEVRERSKSWTKGAKINFKNNKLLDLYIKFDDIIDMLLETGQIAAEFTNDVVRLKKNDFIPLEFDEDMSKMMFESTAGELRSFYIIISDVYEISPLQYHLTGGFVIGANNSFKFHGEFNRNG